jgi:peptide/nickel transport system substrate-binding protein
MDREVTNTTRICQKPLSLTSRTHEHQKPWPVLMAVGIIAILSFSPLILWTPVPLSVSEGGELVVCGTADDIGYLSSGYGGALNPTWADGALEIMCVSNCYDTLVAYDRERVDRFRPLLVTEVPSLENGRINPDGLTYRFTIRSDSPMTPEDVEYSFERVMVCGGSWGNPFLLHEALLGVSHWSLIDNDTIVSFEDIDNAVEVEGNDVVFHLARICPQFMQILASTCSSILSKAWCIEHGDWAGTEETWLFHHAGFLRNLHYGDSVYSPLDDITQGYGPFTFERSYSTGWPNGYEAVVLVRNEDYWRGPAKLESVEFRIYGYSEGFGHDENWETRKQTFLDGDVDICYVPVENHGELDEVEGIRAYTELPTLDYLEIDLNFAIANNSPYIGSGELDGNGIPPDFFSDIDIRKAFAYSIDYDTIINEIYAGRALQPASPVIEALPFHNPDQECYTHDMDRARQHFQQAWGGEVWSKGFNLTLNFGGYIGLGNAETNPHMWMVAEKLKDNIEAINTNFHVTLEPQNVYYFEFKGNSTAVVLTLSDPVTDPGLLEFYPQGYGNTTSESLIEAGMCTVNSTERQAIYYELQKIYHDDVLGIPLVQPLTRQYQRDCVWGWYHNPAKGMEFYEMLKGTYQNATENIIAHVADLIDSGNLGAVAGSSMNETLYSALAFMDSGSLAEASQMLNDFIDQVNALDLPVWDEEELIALAQEIIEVLISTPSSVLIGGTISLPNVRLLVELSIVTKALQLGWKRLRLIKWF